MVAMAGNALPSIGRVRLSDLIASDGLPSDLYKISVSTLTQSFALYSAAIIQLSPCDAALLKLGLESARLYFHRREYPDVVPMNPNNSCEWCKTSGYYADPVMLQESYDYRPGLTTVEPNGALELLPAGLPDIFTLLARASRAILDAVSFHLNLRSFAFTEVLDNIPLRGREISSSVLSVYCHSRLSSEGVQHHNMAEQGDGQMAMFTEDESELDKSLITIAKSDRVGLYIRNFHRQWMLVDADLGPHDIIVYPGLALYQATAGYVSPALHRTEIVNLQGNMSGQHAFTFKLMPKATASLSCSEMQAAGHVVEPQFQLPIQVDDFMRRSHTVDQFFTRQNYSTYDFQVGQDAPLKALINKRKSNERCKHLPPSKRLRLEAQRVLKERVQDIAEKKGIKIRFCNLKDCENHIQILDSPCSGIRMELGWPPGVPFVHPHDLPNKAKIGFLEAYEPGWTASQQDMELSHIQPGQASSQLVSL